MASVCGSSLAMMDAGIPLKAPVAGIAMGLVKEGSNFVVLSDILGDEDHLGEMGKALTTARTEMSEFAPRLITIKIHPDKIREVIGKGGATIRSITEETGTTIDISDDGTIIIGSVNREA